MPALLLALVPLIALAVDRWLGEPPARWHPVVWMGAWLQACAPHVAPQEAGPRSHARMLPFVAGAMAWCLGAAMVALLALALQTALWRWLPAWSAVLVLGLLLKPLLAWRLLREEVQGVEAALAQSTAAGRAQLARLVSRNVTPLSATEVRESALESLAENLNDSVVAPLFWFAVAGLPGAALYRFANTADAMWGYRGARDGRVWEWAGKWAAHADDALSWLPARITALLLALAARRWPRGLRREAARTPSPNSGWPMAAMALLLDVRLAKPGVYALHADGGAAAPSHVPHAIALAGRAAWAAGLLCAAAVFVRPGVLP
ncbi:adenosylcobinamide-phosphate synthase CbiB [Xenophilus arseniciresistens]|uniref:Cobalamin biosynthesis protein CobD n=1 Tax=Xenophilus arseniciresistens TaxID=1283306 RepID=A0AAE3N6U1_9BURK|nr:adenosylcobinamide-phosphate synthase CbiB [Xenophilus arseniciresistens]MDA7415633.1 adenosylcobinamide-phosphate synthase CbiB [Xenophilus arseniciresistens]